MGRKVRLTESELRNLIRRIVEQTNDDGYYRISPEEYTDLMKLSGYHGNGISKLPKFQGKPLYITGSLNLGNTPTDSLGNVGYIDGSLTISNTKISSLGNTVVKGYVSDYGTPLERKRIAAELQKKRNELSQYRDDDEWNPEDTDDLGLKANALFKYLVSEGSLEEIDEDDKIRLSNLKIELTKLEDEYENVEDSELVSDLYDKISDIESEIEELESQNNDVYDLYPNKYSHYGLQTFELLGSNEVYSVGTHDEMDVASLDYAESYIDEVGVDSFNESFIESYIDTDYLKEYVEDWFRDDITQNPDVYFNDSDFELTPEQERTIAEIESQIEDLEQQQSDLDTDREDYDELYDDFQDHIDKLQDDLERIVPDDEPTDDMIEEVLEDKLSDVERNPKYYIQEYGFDLKNFIDEKELAQGLIDSDGWGIMNSYDGNYDSVSFNGTDYYIMRIE